MREFFFYFVAVGPRALAASSGFVPWSKQVRHMQHEIFYQNKRSRGRAPLRLLPIWGRVDVTHSNTFDEREMIFSEQK